MNSTDAFLAAFGGQAPEKPDNAEVQKLGPDERARLFKLGFGTDQKLANYQAPVLVDYEMNVNAGADSTKLLMLDAAMKEGVQYRDLPNGLRSMVKPKRPLAKELRREEDETGYTLDQRQEAFDALQFGVDFLIELADAGLPAQIIAEEYKKVKDRFPVEAVDVALQETNQGLLASLKAGEKAEEYNKEQQQTAADEAPSEDQIRQELLEAQQAIAAANDVSGVTDEALQQELTRRAALRAREAAEAGE